MKAKTSIDEVILDLGGLDNDVNSIISDTEDVKNWIKEVREGLDRINAIYLKRTELTRKEIEDNIMRLRLCHECTEDVCPTCEEIQERITRTLLERAHPCGLEFYNEEALKLKDKVFMRFNPKAEMIYIRDPENNREIILSEEEIPLILDNIDEVKSKEIETRVKELFLDWYESKEDQGFLGKQINLSTLSDELSTRSYWPVNRPQINHSNKVIGKALLRILFDLSFECFGSSDNWEECHFTMNIPMSDLYEEES